MRNKSIVIVLALLFIGITACSSRNIGNNQPNISAETPKENEIAKDLTYTNIKPEEAKKRLDSEKGIILLDVRTQEEYDERHIPNSLLIPVDVIEKEAPSKLTDKNANIFVYCRSGRRSVTASEALIKLGYTQVYNLGGINDWPYKTESSK